VLLQQLVNAIVLGAVYVLVALAFSLVMGILGVLNIAVSELFMIGGYAGVTCLLAGAPVWAALLAAAAAAAVLGIVVERVGYAPFRDSPVIVPLLSTLGFSIILQTVATNVWGSDPIQLASLPLGGSLSFGNVSLSPLQLLIVGVSIGLVAVLALTVQATKLGRALRATAENREVAELLGVPVTLVSITTFALSGILAGAGGFLVALNYGQITPYIGVDVGLKGIAVMVVGGVDRLWGVLVAAPVLAIAQVLTIAYGAASLGDAVIYGMLIVMLLVRPQGILGGGRAAIARA
jgi:branched-chain amino acid transport system permease protein